MSGSIKNIALSAARTATKSALNEVAKKLIPPYGELSEMAYGIKPLNEGGRRVSCSDV